jgi:hypothetical protein
MKKPAAETKKDKYDLIDSDCEDDYIEDEDDMNLFENDSFITLFYFITVIYNNFVIFVLDMKIIFKRNQKKK